MIWPHTVRILRRDFSPTSGYSDFSVIAENVQCLIAPGQPLLSFSSSIGPIPSGDAKAFFPPDTDLKEGDQLIQDDETTWSVVGAPVKFQSPRLWSDHHLEADIRRIFI
jgi:hypothetical protein